MENNLLPRALISNIIAFYDKERMMGNDRGEVRGGGRGAGEDVNSILNPC